MPATILLVDAEPDALRDAGALLERAGFRVRAHAGGAPALDDAAAVEPAALVWAPAAAEAGDLWLVDAYRRRFPARATPLVVLSPSADPAQVAATLEGGADDCLAPPVAPAVLVATLRARVRARARGAPPLAAPALRPAGRLSAIRLGGRDLQIQTEFATVPAPRVVTVVMLGGRAVHHRAAAAPPGAGREELERLVELQHAELEGSVRGKVEARAARRAAADRQARFDRLHDEGLGRFLRGDFAGAVTAWEEAHGIDPGHQALAVNLTVARRKRDAAPSGDATVRARAPHDG